MSEMLEQLQQAADEVLRTVGDVASDAEANVSVTRTRHGLTRFANSFIHQHVGEDTRVVRLTLAIDGRTATASTTDLDPEGMRQLVERTLTSARMQPVDPTWPGATPPAEVTHVGNLDAATADATPDERARLVKDFVDEGPDLRAAGFVDTATTEAAFASTAGQRVAGAATRATLDGIHQTATSAGSSHGTSYRLRDLDASACGGRAADLARRSETAVDIDPGAYPVVLLPEAVATLVTFLAFYGFNGKAHREGASFAQLDAQQFDRAITLTADPTDPRAIGLPFDAEGSPRSRYHLVEDGVTRNLSHDRRTAKAVDARTTGDALPGGEGFGALPGTVLLQPGSADVDAMIGSVERGLLVNQFHYCRILDPKSQVVTGLTRNGTFLIEDGKVAGAVGNLRFTQSFLAALGEGQVTAIGGDDRFASGEFGEGMVLAPSMQLASWNFTGGAKG
ncbi:TldD/PmbA family protein [Nitriliruptor alkaliphilus]|uniref:TldD/PmbA family protein n=1 Tax=Nitriliruptor alkaliphilus TaxID=427918 RepID=UPI0006991114|nr:TldD/PmbA family protein [Nitriliruptor alkaliphilus]